MTTTSEVTKVKSSAYPDLDRSKKKNWVENAGGLPSYIERIAKHLHYEQGMTIGHAIATAVNQCKKWASGVGDVKPDTRAKAAKAIAQWEAKKVKSKLSKEFVHRDLVADPKLSDEFVFRGLIDKHGTKGRPGYLLLHPGGGKSPAPSGGTGGGKKGRGQRSLYGTPRPPDIAAQERAGKKFRAVPGANKGETRWVEVSGSGGKKPSVNYKSAAQSEIAQARSRMRSPWVLASKGTTASKFDILDDTDTIMGEALQGPDGLVVSIFTSGLGRGRRKRVGVYTTPKEAIAAAKKEVLRSEIETINQNWLGG